MMTYSENKAFIEDLQKVIEKHGLAIMYSNNASRLVDQTKHLEGYHMFFTKGEEKNQTNIEPVGNPSNLTIKTLKHKTEDDGC